MSYGTGKDEAPICSRKNLAMKKMKENISP